MERMRWKGGGGEGKVDRLERERWRGWRGKGG